MPTNCYDEKSGGTCVMRRNQRGGVDQLPRPSKLSEKRCEQIRRAFRPTACRDSSFIHAVMQSTNVRLRWPQGPLRPSFQNPTSLPMSLMSSKCSCFLMFCFTSPVSLGCGGISPRLLFSQKRRCESSLWLCAREKTKHPPRRLRL